MNDLLWWMGDMAKRNGSFSNACRRQPCILRDPALKPRGDRWRVGGWS